MAIFNINTSALQDVILASVLLKVNQNRLANSLPALTLPQLVQRLVNDSTDGYGKQRDDESAASIFTAYAASSPAAQAQVKTTLGIA